MKHLFPDQSDAQRKKERPPRVLDVGTGSGIFALWAAIHGCSVVAVDINPRALRFATENARRNNITPSNGVDDAARSLFFSPARFDQEFVKKFGQYFDIVILSPPYNPTWPGIRPALHADAGPDGQSCFREQIELVPGVLARGGCCIGNQMTTIIGDKPSDRSTALVSIEQHFNRHGEYWVRWRHILPPTSARWFLERQYADFLLEDENSLPPDTARNVYTYINEQMAAYKQFALIYYEIHRLDRPKGSPTEEQFDADLVGNESLPSWDYRAWLHRNIVNYTAPQGSTTSGAFLMDASPISAFTPPVRLRTPKEKPDYKNSQLRIINRWVEQIDLLGNHTPVDQSFDLLLVDTAPWFGTLAESALNREECMLWLADGLARAPGRKTELLKAIQEVTALQQVAKVSLFLHPAFVGIGDQSRWTRALFPVLDGGIEPDIKPEITGAEGLWKELQNQLKRHVSVDHDKIHYDPIGYATAQIATIQVADRDEVANAIKQHLSHAREARPDEATDEMTHLRLCAITALNNVHGRFHLILGEEHRPKWITFVGLPLRATPSSSSDLDSYRGGVFLYAESSALWTRNHERRLRDLIRLTWLIYNGYYNAVHAQQVERLAVFSGFLPVEAIERYERDGLAYTVDDAVVMFSDIGGFTALMEQAGAAIVYPFLNETFDKLGECLLAEHGEVDKYIGDAVMVIFRRRENDKSPGLRAVKCGLAMRKAFETVRRAWEARFVAAGAADRIRSANLTIGVAKGSVVFGVVGGHVRRSYTVIGDTVNTAARLQGKAKSGQILIASAVREDAVADPTHENEDILYTFRGQLKLKNKAERVSAYVVTHTAPPT